MLMLRIFHPCRTAGCKEGQLFALFVFLQKLLGFLHNGKICTHCGVVNLIHAHFPQRADNLARDVRPRFEAEFIAQCHANRRCKLYHNALGVVVNRIPEFLCTVPDHDCACRAHRSALSAVHAVCLRKRPVPRSRDRHLRAAVRKVNRAHILYFRTHPHAVSAENALGRIPDNRQRRIVDLRLFFGVFKPDVIDAKPQRQLLQAALAVFRTGGAVAAMAREQ